MTPRVTFCQVTSPPDDLYARYAALVKQNYQLEQALGRGGPAPATAGRGELEEYRALVGMQVSPAGVWVLSLVFGPSGWCLGPLAGVWALRLVSGPSG